MQKNKKNNFLYYKKYILVIFLKLSPMENLSVLVLQWKLEEKDCEAGEGR